MDLTQYLFLATNKLDGSAQGKLIAGIEKHGNPRLMIDMGPFYQQVIGALQIPADKALAAKLENTNAQKLKEFDEKIQDAVENLGETEISDLMIAKALYLTQIGEKVMAELIGRKPRLRHKRKR